MAWIFKAQKITHGSTTAYLPTRSEVYVRDEKDGFVIRRGGNAKDGQHRWANFRKWVKCGSWECAIEVKDKAVCAYGHSSTPWLGGAGFDLPEYSGENWAKAQQKWRSDAKKG